MHDVALLITQKGNMRHSFVKESIGFNPLLTVRDWVIFGCLYGAILIAYLVAVSRSAGYDWNFVLIGAMAGSMPSVFACIPVRGRVAAERVVGFLARVEQFRFEPAGETAEGRIYNLKGPRWGRWDSNRVVTRTNADGSLQVTAPFYFYWRLKRLQS